MIVGLGNPGEKYANTKHNVGFWVIDEIADRAGVKVDKSQCQALIQTAEYQGKKVLLVKPQTFMNLSGHAVMQLLHYYKDRIDDILVIHDDMDLPVGKIRMKKGGGGAGGHNGIKNIIEQLNSNDFERLKVGIGRGRQAIEHVMTPFIGQDKLDIEQATKTAADAVGCWLLNGVEKTMNQYNG